VTSFEEVTVRLSLNVIPAQHFHFVIPAHHFVIPTHHFLIPTHHFVIPAKAGIHLSKNAKPSINSGVHFMGITSRGWIPSPRRRGWTLYLWE
jgi:hypothetical protein